MSAEVERPVTESLGERKVGGFPTLAVPSVLYSRSDFIGPLCCRAKEMVLTVLVGLSIYPATRLPSNQRNTDRCLRSGHFLKGHVLSVCTSDRFPGEVSRHKLLRVLL